VHLIHFSIH